MSFRRGLAWLFGGLLALSTAVFGPERAAASSSARADSLVGDWTSPNLGRENVHVRATGDSTVAISTPGGFVAQCFFEGRSLVGLARFRAPGTLGRADWPRFMFLRATWANPTTLSVTWILPVNGKPFADDTWYFLGRVFPGVGGDPALDGQGRLPDYGDYVYVEVLPEAITKVSPTYPDEAREKKVDGTVMVQALVGTDGLVKDVKVVKSIPLLDDAAMAAVRQWRFKPAMGKDRPVAVWVGVPVKFSLH